MKLPFFFSLIKYQNVEYLWHQQMSPPPPKSTGPISTNVEFI